MMGFADFPVEIFKAFASKSMEEKRVKTDSITPLPSRTNFNDEQSDAASITVTSSSHSPNSSTTSLASSPQKEGHFATLDDRRSNDSQPHIEKLSQGSETGDATEESRLGQERKTTSRHTSRQNSERSPQISFDTALGAGKGVSRIVGAGLKSPMDFTLGLAKGFHNAPKLYGDSSVRKADKITGFQSGLRAAGKVFSPEGEVSSSTNCAQEFGYGFYDGISGLVTQPFEGAKKEGIAGLIKGFGKGIGGVVLKPGAGRFSPVFL